MVLIVIALLVKNLPKPKVNIGVKTFDITFIG